eukprot:TRINITY_DN64823_c0_g1_i1.p1 TRINITY_DN64823_c0_g1~~TRINITY_DN64823_c0_g1_i1.p1  ORF type:complete len:456 (+),score=107.37 TRINITY_DN64823_c0_g1_i1:127-1494(+)
MFNAYPQRERHAYWKLFLPIIVIAAMCLVLYSAFEYSEGDSRMDDEVSNLKRLHPFLSSQSFEIGLWTRQKGADALKPKKHTPPPLPLPADELSILREQLQLERSRTAQQQSELIRLRGAVAAAEAKSSQQAVPPTSPPLEVSAEDSIPESLWKEPPVQEATTKTPALKALAPASSVSAQAPLALPKVSTSVPTAAPAKLDSQDSTITVKAGGKEIILQISQDQKDIPAAAATPATAEVPAAAPAGAPAALSSSNVGQFTTLAPQSAARPEEETKSEANTVGSKSNSTSSEGSKANGQDDSDSGTQITVRSGQQSITIEVRQSDDDREAKAAPVVSSVRAEDSLVAQNTSVPVSPAPTLAPKAALLAPPAALDSSPASAAPVSVLPERALPQLPDYEPPEVKVKDSAAAGDSDSQPAALPTKVPESAAAAAEVVSDKPGASAGSPAYANLALRAR